ncbi:MAG TPA: hypothetical protein VKU82_11450 [Planctomycetaceae bacterium]|nr:hypothetical protein [Planctomycetaceae bacterium]
MNETQPGRLYAKILREWQATFYASAAAISYNAVTGVSRSPGALMPFRRAGHRPSRWNPIPMPGVLLEREEYIEQAYLFRVFRERLDENVPAQEILSTVHEEILSTTKLPLAIGFLKGEILHTGRLSLGMAHLAHYFTPFQTFVMARAEEDRSRFDQKTALDVLHFEARYRADAPTPAGLFAYQFESVSRNKLGYDRGMEAMALDPLYDETWREWILRARLQLGAVDFADLMYLYSQEFINERRRLSGDDFEPSRVILFGAKEGRIAKANRGKDPLYMFAALQRHLGYPVVPRLRPTFGAEREIPALQAKLAQMEKRLQLIESELKGNLDLSQFYVKPTSAPPPVDDQSRKSDDDRNSKSA